MESTTYGILASPLETPAKTGRPPFATAKTPDERLRHPRLSHCGDFMIISEEVAGGLPQFPKNLWCVSNPAARFPLSRCATEIAHTNLEGSRSKCRLRRLPHHRTCQYAPGQNW